MPKVSRWKVEPENLDVMREDFWAVVSLLEDKREVREFLSNFLTPSERTMLAKRFQVLLMLVAGYSYEAIKNRTHVALDTISRVANRLEEDATGILLQVAARINQIKQEKVQNWEKSPKARMPGDLATPLAKKAIQNITKKTI